MDRPGPASYSAEDAFEPADLGPVLQETRTNHGRAVVAVLGGLLLSALGALCFTFTPPGQAEAAIYQWVIGGLFLVWGACALVAGVVLFRRYRGFTLYLHEHGVRQVVRGREYVIPFADAEELTFQSMRIVVNGTYGGTVERIGVRTGEPGGSMVYFQRKYEEKTGRETGYRTSTEAERLGGRIAARIAGKLAARLDRGESLAWTPKMRIDPRGVEVPNGWGGRRFVEWERIARVAVDKGVFRLWVEGRRGPVVALWTGLPNFLPGFLLVTSILNQQAAAPREAASVPGSTPGEVFAVEYTQSAEDHVMLARHHDRASPAGREGWLIRTSILPGFATFIALVIVLAKYLKGDYDGWVFAALLAASGFGGVLAYLAWSALLLGADRRRITRELRLAHELAANGEGAEPFERFEVAFGPLGYALRRGDAEVWRPWGQVAAVERYRGYIITRIDGGKVRDDWYELIAPPRAFGAAGGTRRAFGDLSAWHGAARPRA